MGGLGKGGGKGGAAPSAASKPAPKREEKVEVSAPCRPSAPANPARLHVLEEWSKALHPGQTSQPDGVQESEHFGALCGVCRSTRAV